MSDRNYVHVSGNLCRDPELRFTSNGKGVTSFTLANNYYGDKTNFLNCTAWDKGKYELAKYVAEQCVKGDKLDIEAEIVSEEYEGKTRLKFNVISFINCTNKKQSGQANNQSNKQTDNSNTNTDIDEDFDVPF